MNKRMQIVTFFRASMVDNLYIVMQNRADSIHIYQEKNKSPTQWEQHNEQK
jgi:hypothetical protein